MKQAVTAHIVVKNEDQWLYFALHSILPYADQILICDTGSSDHTLDIIKSVSSPKIQFTSQDVKSASDLTNIRNLQIKQTKTPWIWIVDGDEIYPHETITEIDNHLTKTCKGIVVRRYDLLGDIYHRQIESVGEYELLGQKGHLVTRLINLTHFPGLHVARPYPLEAYLNQNDQVVHSYDQANWYITNNYLYHAMYLRRSSLGAVIPMLNRSKYKIETGIPIKVEPPSIFQLAHPPFAADPHKKRGFLYNLAAAVITPVKTIKRQLL